jgi:hypothetical protein
LGRSSVKTTGRSILKDHESHNTEKVKYKGVEYWVCHDCKKTLGRACEVYSRIVGYLRPVDNWNKGKKQEFKDRKTYGVFKVQKGRQEVQEV